MSSIGQPIDVDHDEGELIKDIIEVDPPTLGVRHEHPQVNSSDNENINLLLENFVWKENSVLFKMF